MIDEKSLRTPAFQPGVPVKLGDGQEYHFPRPMLELYPVIDEQGQVSFSEHRWRFREESADELVDQLLDAETVLEEANAAVALAYRLLQKNYTLAPEHLRTLLPYKFDDETNKEMWGSIYDVVLGRSPKPIASGSGSSAG